MKSVTIRAWLAELLSSSRSPGPLPSGFWMAKTPEKVSLSNQPPWLLEREVDEWKTEVILIVANGD